MGANACVWERLLPLIETSWNGRWLVPDLRGHGRSARRGPYGVGMHAADVAALIESERAGPVTLVGHSFGGVVAPLVASGWFGPAGRDVAAFGVKIEWTPDEKAKARELARRPAPVFATRDEAIARYLRISQNLLSLVVSQDVGHADGRAWARPSRQRPGAVLSHWAGFQMSTTGRFWVSTEGNIEQRAATLS